MIINSPYTGRPVKIRDQDVGRALRDDEGHIFYAVPRSDGAGYYGAPTRRGSDKDEQRYLKMEMREAQAREMGKIRSDAQIHDATGNRMIQLRRRAARVILLVVVVLLLLILAAGVLAIYRHYTMPGSPPLPYWPTQWTPGGSGGQGSGVGEQGTDGAGSGPVSINPPPPRGATQTVDRLLRKRGIKNAAPMRIAPVSETFTPGTVGRTFLTLYGEHNRAEGNARHMAAKAATPNQEASHVPPPTGDAARHPLNSPRSALDAPHPSAWVTLGSGLKYRILKAGDGQRATAGKYVVVKVYRPKSIVHSPESRVQIPKSGIMDDGLRTEDSSVGFVLWSGQRPRAWDLGIAGMRVGEKREVQSPKSKVHSPKSRVQSPEFKVRSRKSGTMDDGRWTLDFELVDVKPGVTRKPLKVEGAGKVGETEATSEARGHAPRLKGESGGAMVRPGDTVTVRYTGYVQGVKQPFDVSHSRPSDPPLTFVLGAGQVMPGWDLGLAGARVGRTYELTIPPYLAYGKEGVGALIPAHATLRYVITVVGVKRAGIGD